MKGTIKIAHEFVEYIPDELEDGTLYVSMPLATAVHKCCCGCGNEVVTPLSPTDWKLFYDGVSVSLTPSIGNWNFACQSHYWIKNSRVKWAKRWSREEIDAGRAYDAWSKEKYFDSLKTSTDHDAKADAEGAADYKSKESLWQKVKNWLF